MADGREQPEQYSNAWYRQQLFGLNHAFNRLSYEYETQYKASVLDRERIAKLETEREELMCKIGELFNRLDELEQKHDKMAKWLKEKHSKEKNGAPA